MITKFFLQLVGGVISFVVGLIPSVPRPSWFADVVTWVTSACNGVAGLSNYFPIGSLIIGLTFILGVYATAFGVRLFRMVLSGLTGGGGAT